MKTLLKIMLLLLFVACTGENIILEQQRKAFAKEVRKKCTNGTCYTSVLCHYTNGEYNYAIYKYGNKYYDIAWIISLEDDLTGDRSYNKIEALKICEDLKKY